MANYTKAILMKDSDHVQGPLTSLLLSENTTYTPGMRWALHDSQRFGEHSATILGEQFVILPEVFSPDYYSESAFFARQVIERLRPGEDYLDVGCGAGVTAVLAAKKGVHVTALDINQRAVQNTILNAGINDVSERVRVLQSDVYKALAPDRKFDTIYWNTPFAYVDKTRQLTPLERAVFDPGYASTRMFIVGARQHLHQGGEMLIGFSSTLGNLPALQAFADEAGLTMEKITETLEDNNPKEVHLELFRGTFQK